MAVSNCASNTFTTHFHGSSANQAHAQATHPTQSLYVCRWKIWMKKAIFLRKACDHFCLKAPNTVLLYAHFNPFSLVQCHKSTSNTGATQNIAVASFFPITTHIRSTMAFMKCCTSRDLYFSFHCLHWARRVVCCVCKEQRRPSHVGQMHVHGPL